MNYIIRETESLKFGIMAGGLVYITAYLLLYAIKKERRKIRWKNLAELLFGIYFVTLLRITGILSLHFGKGGSFGYNLVPFIGSSFIPTALNFCLFFPYGFLLPAVFPSGRWNWKKIVSAGMLTSLCIEILQLFGGRYAEIDDVLMNTIGVWSGYMVYRILTDFAENRKRAFCRGIGLCAVLLLCFAGIYAVGDHESGLPDGLMAAADDILETSVYFDGKKTTVDKNAEVYHYFADQLSNCGGHVFEIQSVSENEIWNSENCFIEVIYNKPQNIRFQNTEDFSIRDADRILYNADTNMLYWGNQSYRNAVDYTRMDSQQQEHANEILEGYEQLSGLILEYYGL